MSTLVRILRSIAVERGTRELRSEPLKMASMASSLYLEHYLDSKFRHEDIKLYHSHSLCFLPCNHQLLLSHIIGLNSWYARARFSVSRCISPGEGGDYAQVSLPLFKNILISLHLIIFQLFSCSFDSHIDNSVSIKNTNPAPSILAPFLSLFYLFTFVT